MTCREPGGSRGEVKSTIIEERNERVSPSLITVTARRVVIGTVDRFGVTY